MAGGVALAGVAAVAVTIVDTRSLLAEEDVDLPDPDAVGPGGQDCVPEGCELWRVEAAGEGPVVASDDLVVALGRDEIVAFDAEDGEERWRRASPRERQVNSGALALSEHGLAFVSSSSPPSVNTVDPDEDATTVTVLDVADGERRFDVGLPIGHLYELVWVEDRLVGIGSAGRDVAAGTERTVVVALSAAGDRLWHHEAEGFPRLPIDEDALLWVGDGISRLDLTDGRVLWSAAGEAAPFFSPRDEDWLVTVDRAAGEVIVVDNDDGASRQAIAVDEPQAAGPLGPWVAVAADGQLRVHDVDSGAELFRRSWQADSTAGGEFSGFPGLHHGASAVTSDDRVAVAWLDDVAQGEVELATYTRDGTLEDSRTVGVPIPEDVPAPALWIQLWEGWEGTVLLTAFGPPDDGFVTRIDLDTHEVLDAHDNRQPVGRADDLLVTRDPGGLHVRGAGGVIEVRNADELVATDPLIVQGGAGILRLDRSLVTAAPDVREVDPTEP